MNGEKIEDSLIRSIGKSGGYELLSETTEWTIDQLLQDGPIKDIPIVGGLLKLYKTGAGVREFLFIKKLQKFLFSLKSIPEEQREQFSGKLDTDPKKRSETGEKLLLLLEKFDESEKPDLLGRAFVAYIREEIDFETFWRMGRAIERCMVADLRFVHNFERATDAFSDRAFDLASCGLVELVAMPDIRGPGAKNLYKLTDFGEQFVRTVL